jgi:patatin-related protein
MDKENQRERSQEVRLGLVMYGGVSLAIYINGVAQEFFRAVRGRGIYRLLKALTDSDIVVDIISGSSAGGINGVLLAYALCNELEFPACASLWRHEGDFLKLLRSPRQGVAEATSVLDGDHYQACLEKALAEMPEIIHDQPEYVSQSQELDLFVTGTDVHGRIYTTFDELGNPIEVKDHRTLFLLKHRAGRKEPFAVKEQRAGRSEIPDITRRSLAKLSRITSTFPAAFPPVHVAGEGSADKVDANLHLWGWFDGEAYFLDGGVLDNKPFTYTIREIFYRLASRRVDRKLFYVEPDPKRFEKPHPVQEPNMVEVIFKSLVSIPGYESIADDLKLLAEHNDRVERHKKLVEALENAAPPGDQQGWEEAGRASPLYRQTRISFLAERVVRGILKQDGHHRFPDPNVRALAAELYKSVHTREKMWQEALEDFDVYFRLRRLFHVLYSCPDPEPGCSPEENRLRRDFLHHIGRQIKLLEIVAAAMERLIGEADFKLKERQPRQIDEVLHKVQAALKNLLNLGRDGPAPLPEGYEDAWKVIAPDEWLNQPALSRINQALGERVAAIKDLVQDDAPVLTSAINSAPAAKLFEVTDACEARMLAYFSREIERLGLADLANLTIKYNNFIWLDAQLFPLEAFAGFGERDVIETVRISPLDAQRGFSRVAAASKVSGDVLHHFGGFFKKSWRSNDILWGRLDGLCLLVETLFKADNSRNRVKKILEDSHHCQSLRSDLQNHLNPAVLFPHASRQTQETLRDWLGRLVSGHQQEREAALEEFDLHLELLIEAAHLEILYKEVPRVISDALEEQARWGQAPGKVQAAERGAGSTSPSPGAWSSFQHQGTAGLDQLLLSVSAEELAKQAMAEMAATPPAGKDAGWPRDDGLGRFFVEKYRVGGESLLNDVPRAYLGEMMLTLLPVARHCVVKATDKYAETLRKNLLFKYFDGLLRWGVRVAGWFFRQPTWKKVVAGVAGAAVVLALFRKLLF